MSYTEDLERCCRLLKGILYITELITSWEDQSPYLTAMVFNLVNGIPATIKTECEQDGFLHECEINAHAGSLNDIMDVIEHTISLLELEVVWESGGFYTDSIPDTKLW